MAAVQSVEGAGQWVRIALAGEIDVATTELIRDTVAAARADHPDATLLELDFGGVTLIDSTGVGTVVSVHRGLAEQGIRVILTNPVKIVERVLRVTGVYETLTGSGVAARRKRGPAR